MIKTQGDEPSLFSGSNLTENYKTCHLAMRDNDIADHMRRVRALLHFSEHLCNFGSWELDTSGNVVYWSKQMSKLHGYPPEKSPSNFDDWFSTVAADEREAIEAHFDQILNGQSDQITFAYDWRSFDGDDYRSLTVVAEPILKGDSIVGIRGVVRRAGSTEAVPEASGATENRYGVYLRALPAPIAIWRKSGDNFVLIETNDALNVLSKGRSAELVGQSAAEIFAERPQVLDDMHTCYTTNSIVSREVKDRVIPNGDIRDYNTSFIRIDDMLIVFSVDISARKEIERRYQENERQYRQLFENVHQGICILDRERRIKLANSTLLKALGYQLAEIKNQLFLDFVDDDYRSRAKEYVSTSLGSIIPRELSLTTKDGSHLYVLVSIRSISDEQSVENSLVEITDITSLKQTERNLVHLQRELEQAQSEGDKKEAALSAVLTHIDTERSNYRKQVHQRVYRAILPYLERLKSSEQLSDMEAQEMEEAMMVSLDHDVDDYEVHKDNLSPKEELICKDIAAGMTSKEISDKLYLSVETVRKHRKSIRRKLKLTRKGANLTTYLRQHLSSED